MEPKSELNIFERAKKNLALIDLDQNKRPLHRKQLLHVIEGFLALVLQCLYFVIDAKKDREYMSSMLMTSIGILVYLTYWNAIFGTTTIYELIDSFEISINGSKFAYSI